MRTKAFSLGGVLAVAAVAVGVASAGPPAPTASCVAEGATTVEWKGNAATVVLQYEGGLSEVVRYTVGKGEHAYSGPTPAGATWVAAYVQDKGGSTMGQVGATCA